MWVFICIDLTFVLIDTAFEKIVDPKSGDEKPVTISVDDGIRPSTTIADLAKLRPVFKKDGSTTAGSVADHAMVLVFDLYKLCSANIFLPVFVGNSSQVSDGAGAVLLMKRSIAMQKGLPILGVFRYINCKLKI